VAPGAAGPAGPFVAQRKRGLFDKALPGRFPGSRVARQGRVGSRHCRLLVLASKLKSQPLCWKPVRDGLIDAALTVSTSPNL